MERHGRIVKSHTNFIRCKKNIVVLLNLCHSVNAGVHWFPESDLLDWFNLLLKQKKHDCCNNKWLYQWKSVWGSTSAFFRDLPLLKRNSLLRLKTIKQNNNNTQPKRANPFVSWLFAFRGFLNSWEWLLSLLPREECWYKTVNRHSKQPIVWLKDSQTRWLFSVRLWRRDLVD